MGATVKRKICICRV